METKNANHCNLEQEAAMGWGCREKRENTDVERKGMEVAAQNLGQFGGACCGSVVLNSRREKMYFLLLLSRVN